jgi:hypothetical protein
MKEWNEGKKAFDNLLKYCGVEKITPGNFEYVKEKASELYVRRFVEIGKEWGVSPEIAYCTISLIVNPPPNRLEYLKWLYNLSEKKEWISCKEIREKSSSTHYISLLKAMGIITNYKKEGRKGYIKVDRNILEKFYPEVKNFNYLKISQNEPNKNKAKQGERIKQALEILGVNSLDKLNEKHIPQIEKLSPVDFFEKNIRLTSREVHSIKNRLINKIMEKKLIVLEK